MIRCLLVANRGEIARRVFRTARNMGMRTAAVFVDADAGAPFVRDADVAVRLATGYLDGDAVIAAARAAGADAVHPGYGFLSENAGFARAVIDAGLTWVGPSPDVIEQMGDKLAAKRAAAGAGVPTLPSTEDPADAESVGYPILVKAAAGGGGKGMRVVTDAADLAEAVAAARREAGAGFGDDRVFLERYVERSRHIEIQILGDHHGGLVHLGERECSIQRRHQKIIEESPSPAIDDERRGVMGEAALRLAGALGYESAGTVELLVDDASDEFFFLEVNTRLQVEHPVTEAVTGIDLVREQLRIAAGEPLGYDQAAITMRGHAVEARLYAEEPAAGFLPATGTLSAFRPAANPAVRWDTGVEAGSVVGLDFDPMLAKVIAHAPTREEAAGRLARALEGLHVGGVTTNAPFLAATLRSDAFLAGDTTTDFIERVAPATAVELDEHELAWLAAAAALWLQGEARAGAPVLAEIPSGWRNARLPDQHTALVHGDQHLDVRYRSHRDGAFSVSVSGDAVGPRSEDGSVAERRRAIVHDWSPSGIDVEIDGLRRHVAVTRAGERLHVQAPGGTVDLAIAPRFPRPESTGPAGGLVAPMPGVATDVRVAAGDRVTARQVLVVLEAMKMEHHITAPADGLVVEVRVQAGSQVHNGELLLVVEPDTDGAESSG